MTEILLNVAGTSNPASLLADLICDALVDADIVGETSIKSLKQQILSGKAKAEDWKLAVEKNISTKEIGFENGN